jgi:histone-lysine N-methyltransferase EZH2
MFDHLTSPTLILTADFYQDEEIPMPNLIPPSVTNNALIASVEKPCGALCFVLGGVSSSIASTTD